MENSEQMIGGKLWTAFLSDGGSWPGRDWLRGMPLLAKVMGIAIGMAVLLGGALFWQIQTPYSRLEAQEVEAHAEFVALTLAAGVAPLVRSGRFLEVQTMLEQMAQVTPDINAAISSLEVRDGAGRVLARTGGGRAPTRPGRLIENTAPLPDGVPGSVSVGLNDAHVEFEVAWHTHRIVATTALIGLVGVVATWWLMGLVMHPLQALVRNTQAIQEGHYHTRAAVQAQDEVGELATAFNQMAAALQKKDALNRQLLQKAVSAAEEERKRVARELHDHTGQALTSLAMGLAALENGAPTGLVTSLRSQTTQLLGEVHDLALALRPNVLEDLGLGPALERYCQGVGQRSGVEVACGVVGWEPGGRLPAEVEVAAYRIVQEGLNNAVRHGRARAVEVLVQRQEGSLLVVIEDNGRGFEASDWRTRCEREDHLGLLGIEERAALLGGSLRVESQPGAGAHLFVEIPLQEPAHV